MSRVHTKDIPDSFEKAFLKVCEEIKCEPFDLLGVMMSESGLRADAWNDNPKDRPQDKRWNAVGLIQFMPAILPGCGWHGGYQAFRHLDATQQLPYVKNYFAGRVDKYVSAGQLYQACFLPATLKNGSDPSTRICVKGGQLGWAYDANALFDANRNGDITVGELTAAIERNARGPRWAEMVARLNLAMGGEEKAPDVSSKIDPKDLTTVAGVQSALGITVDGVAGPVTRAAVADFQNTHGLLVDGIVGPKTRAALAAALASAAPPPPTPAPSTTGETPSGKKVKS